jgi:DNA replication and repair protein RecF
MWIRELSLQHFRNYRQLDLPLPSGLALFLGDNAQGKSNLLEAVFLLATTRSDRAQTDGELVSWEVLDSAQPIARVSAQIARADGDVQLEVIVVGRPRGSGAARLPASKRLRVNGVPKRQAGMVGQLMAVLFTTEDIELIGGPPSGRRRFMDVALSQVDPAYVRASQAYTKVMTQRNALLRRIQSGDGDAEELDFWDDELAREGAVVVQQRARTVAALATYAPQAHADLSAGREQFTFVYEPRLPGWDAQRVLVEPSAVEAALLAAHQTGRGGDVGAGMTLVGPHRDDLSLQLDGEPASAFASRGQQRTAALALRLAEARFMAERKGDRPVVLLDDVLSELDEGRRQAVLSSLGDWDQLLITSADADRFGERLAADSVYRVVSGQIESITQVG